MSTAAQNGNGVLAERCRGLRVAVDVQHLYRASHPNDRGTIFKLVGGTTVAEAALATGYAQALAEHLRARGATVFVNNPATGMLCGYYSTRNRQAAGLGVHAYLACHVNAGRGGYALLEYMDPQAPGRGSGPGVVGAARLANWIGASLDQFPAVLGYRTNALRHGQRGAVCIEGCGPAVAALVVEPFFGDNPGHQALVSAAGLASVGEVIGQGVASWWGAGHAGP